MLYTNKNSPKAKLLYDLSECEVKGNYISESILNQSSFLNLNKNNVKKTSNNSLGESISKQLTSVKLSSILLEEQKENISSNRLGNPEKPNSINFFKTKMNSTSNVFGIAENTFERFSFNKFDDQRNINIDILVNGNINGLFKQRLNYEIEINHPFLEKSFIRGSNVLEAFDLHKRMQQINAEFD